MSSKHTPTMKKETADPIKATNHNRTTKQRHVAYFHEPEIASFEVGTSNPAKPFRACLAHRLIDAYKLFPKLIDLNKVRLATVSDLAQYHSDNYVQMLQIVDQHLQSVMNTVVSNEVVEHIENVVRKYNLSLARTNANQAFLGIVDYCRLYTTGSLAAAACLNSQSASIAINWCGGMSRPRVESAGMGSFVNDSVLATLELLKCHNKVAYISLDYWHPIGVEEAFYTSPQVLTVSFHGSTPVPGYRTVNNPGTRSWAPNGDLTHQTTIGSTVEDIGTGMGTGYAVNVPFPEGLDDDTLLKTFKVVLSKVKESFDPSAVVLQCGTSGLRNDRLGNWSLTPRGIGECVREVRDWEIPLLVLGGQGVDLANAARTWCWCTAVLAGEDEAIADSKVPDHVSKAYFEPDLSLHRSTPESPNTVRSSETEQTVNQVLKNLELLKAHPVHEQHQTLLLGNQG